MYMKTERLYRNKEWLEDKYWGKKLSTYKIDRLCNVDHHTILNWLKKLNISIRSREEGIYLSKANHCNLSQETIEWINGELLGDGHLQSKNSHSARFAYSSKYLEYTKYVSNILASFGIERIGKIRKYYYEKMDCYTYSYNSRYYIELLSIRRKWYPNGKKIIPRDLELTPLVCRQWFIGDGSLKHYKNYSPYIKLATCGFSIKDVEWLILQLSKLGFKTTRQPNQNLINISTKSTKQFLNYIGSCPVKCYQYKWDFK